MGERQPRFAVPDQSGVDVLHLAFGVDPVLQQVVVPADPTQATFSLSGAASRCRIAASTMELRMDQSVVSLPNR
jgi:hypothetical protein